MGSRKQQSLTEKPQDSTVSLVFKVCSQAHRAFINHLTQKTEDTWTDASQPYGCPREIQESRHCICKCASTTRMFNW